MLNYSNIKISEAIVHFIGNKNTGESCRYSKKSLRKLTPDTEKFLIDLMISPFRDVELFEFSHHVDIQHNDVYSFCKEIFDSHGKSFIQGSKYIGSSLYENSIHPKVRSGEVCIFYFSNAIINDQVTDGIGIFKSETKEPFIKFEVNDQGNFEIQKHTGIGNSKMEKGCLIFNINKETGFQIASIDSVNSKNAQYWNDHFLSIRPTKDEFYYTKNILSTTKLYIENQIEQEFEVTRTDKIDLLNRSIDYFKTNDIYKKQDFEDSVLQDKEIIKSFRSFKSEYMNENSIEIADKFVVSDNALRKQSKFFKSILKLDKNFHVYIHGDKNLIQHGVDNDGKKYYKLYYENET